MCPSLLSHMDKDHKTFPSPEQVRGQKNSNAGTRVVKILLKIHSSVLKALIPGETTPINKGQEEMVTDFFHPRCVAALWIEAPGWHKEWEVMVGQWNLQVMQFNHGPQLGGAETSRYQDQESPYFLQEDTKPSSNIPLHGPQFLIHSLPAVTPAASSPACKPQWWATIFIFPSQLTTSD